MAASPRASPPLDLDVWLVPDANVMRMFLAGPAWLAFNIYPSIQITSPTYPGASPPQASAYWSVGVLGAGQSATLTASATVASPNTVGGAYILVWGMDAAGLIFVAAYKVLPPATYNAGAGASVTYRLTVGVS